MVRDPRVETLTSWARSEGKLSVRAATALAALEESLPSSATASAIAYVVSAAYARLPCTGPRDSGAGNRLIGILAELGEAGAQELLGLQDAVTYRHARHAIGCALAELKRRPGVPDPELEDEFAGVELNVDLKTLVPVGPYAAVLGVTPDLRRVRTTWRNEAGQESSRRPSRAVEFAEDLEAVEDVRRRLRAHVTALRRRLERAMIAGEPWIAEAWTARMFGDPLRAAMARRLIWRVDCDMPVLVLQGGNGLRNIDGDQVNIRPQTPITLWHPANDPAAQEGWRQRLAELGVTQPIEQAKREVTLADPSRARLLFAVGERVEQRAFRGFLRNRGWDVPYMGHWFFIGEAAREVVRGEPIAVLTVDLDWEAAEPADIVVVGDLWFRLESGSGVDACWAGPRVVSEAARDVLGAIAASRVRDA
jgi:hypothetical protein